MNKVGEQLGVQVRRASPAFVREHTSQPIGGIAPVGHPQPIRTIVDRALAEFEVLWAAGGIPHAVFPLTYGELIRLTGGVEADVVPPRDRGRYMGLIGSMLGESQEVRFSRMVRTSSSLSCRKSSYAPPTAMNGSGVERQTTKSATDRSVRTAWRAPTGTATTTAAGAWWRTAAHGGWRF